MSALPEEVTGYNNCLNGQAVVPVDSFSLNKGLAIVPVDRMFFSGQAVPEQGTGYIIKMSQLSLNKGQAVVPVDILLSQYLSCPQISDRLLSQCLSSH